MLGVNNDSNRAQDYNNINNLSIPGIFLPVQNVGTKLLLLSGPSGVGKTLYCRQFMLEGAIKGDKCIFISTDLSKMQFDALFSNVENRSNILDHIEFINQYDNGFPSNSNNEALSGKGWRQQ